MLHWLVSLSIPATLEWHANWLLHCKLPAEQRNKFKECKWNSGRKKYKNKNSKLIRILKFGSVVCEFKKRFVCAGGLWIAVWHWMQVSRQINSETDKCSFHTVSAEPQCRESCHLPDCLPLPEEIINKQTGRWMTQTSIPASSQVKQLRIINHWLGTIRLWILTNHILVFRSRAFNLNPRDPLLCVTSNIHTLMPSWMWNYSPFDSRENL